MLVLGRVLAFTFGLEILILTLFLAWKDTFGSRMYFIPDFDHTQGYYEVTPEVRFVSTIYDWL